MENGPSIDGLPIKTGDFPWLYTVVKTIDSPSHCMIENGPEMRPNSEVFKAQGPRFKPCPGFIRFIHQHREKLDDNPLKKTSCCRGIVNGHSLQAWIPHLARNHFDQAQPQPGAKPGIREPLCQSARSQASNGGFVHEFWYPRWTPFIVTSQNWIPWPLMALPCQKKSPPHSGDFLGTQAVPNKRRAKSKISSSCAFSAAAWSMDGCSTGNWMIFFQAQGFLPISYPHVGRSFLRSGPPLVAKVSKVRMRQWFNLERSKGLNGNTSFLDPTCSAPWNFGQLLCFGAPVHASARRSPNPPQAQVGTENTSTLLAIDFWRHGWLHSLPKYESLIFTDHKWP